MFSVVPIFWFLISCLLAEDNSFVPVATQQTTQQFDCTFTSGATHGFLPYYGEGGNTAPEPFTRISGTQGQGKIELGFVVTPHFTVGVFVDGRSFENTQKISALPNENSLGFGIFKRIDSRDDRANPTSGFLFQAKALAVPTHTLFFLLETECSFFQRILSEKRFVAAFQFAGGVSLGEASPLYRFRLGGAKRLRGYDENRFRGKAYYVQQSEIRFPLAWNFSGAAFLSFGDTTDQAFTHPKMSYGAGLRVALPQAFQSHVRVDVAAGHDQLGVFADFGHSF